MSPLDTKIRKLIRQYPFITKILNHKLEPLGPRANRVDNINVTCEQVDTDLMYRRARNMGLGSDTCYTQSVGKYKGYKYRRGEYLFIVGTEGNIIRIVFWPMDEYSQSQTKERYVRDILLESITAENNYPTPLWVLAKHLVWVSVETLHKDTTLDYPKDRAGSVFFSRNLAITIYRKPDNGFKPILECSSLENNLRVDSKLLVRAKHDNNLDVLNVYSKIQELCAVFQETVYAHGLKTAFRNEQDDMYTLQLGQNALSCTDTLGFDVISLKNSVCKITFGQFYNTNLLQINDCEGTLPELRTLITDTIRLWFEKRFQDAVVRENIVS